MPRNFQDRNRDVFEQAVKDKLKNNDVNYILPYRERGEMTLIGRPKADLSARDDFSNHTQTDGEYVRAGGAAYMTSGAISLRINERPIISDTVIVSLEGSKFNRHQVETEVEHAAKKIMRKIKSISWID